LAVSFTLGWWSTTDIIPTAPAGGHERHDRNPNDVVTAPRRGQGAAHSPQEGGAVEMITFDIAALKRTYEAH
jgi:hypothetical protein